MEYYFTVITNHNLYNDTTMLVKAKDVVDAGRKVENMLTREGMDTWGIEIVEITRTNITKIID